MNNFNLDNCCGSVRVQYWRCIFNNTSYYTFIAIALNTTGTMAKVFMQKGIDLHVILWMWLFQLSLLLILHNSLVCGGRWEWFYLSVFNVVCVWNKAFLFVTFRNSLGFISYLCGLSLNRFLTTKKHSSDI